MTKFQFILTRILVVVIIFATVYHVDRTIQNKDRYVVTEAAVLAEEATRPSGLPVKATSPSEIKLSGSNRIEYVKICLDGMRYYASRTSHGYYIIGSPVFMPFYGVERCSQ